MNLNSGTVSLLVTQMGVGIGRVCLFCLSSGDRCSGFVCSPSWGLGDDAKENVLLKSEMWGRSKIMLQGNFTGARDPNCLLARLTPYRGIPSWMLQARTGSSSGQLPWGAVLGE